MLKNSIKYKIVSTVIMIILPFLIIINYNNIYYLKTIRNQIAQSSVTTTSLYMAQIDKSIKEIEDYLVALFAINGSITDLNSSNESSRLFTNYNLARMIQNDMPRYDIASLLFIYSKTYDYYIYAFNDNTSFAERKMQENYLKSIVIHSEVNNKKWIIVPVNGENYLLKVLTRDDVYIGVWIDFNTIAKPLESIGNKYDATFIFSDLKGLPMTNMNFVDENTIKLNGDMNNYYLSGNPKRYLITGENSKNGDFRLLVAHPDKNMFEGLNSKQYFILVISFLAVLILPFLLCVIYKWIIYPMEKLKYAINRIENGDLDYRIKNEKTSNEFRKLDEAFNSMTSQIKALKINVYEEIIEKQKMELRYLQLQIKPHFFLNALTTVSNFAKMEKYESMQDFILYLSNYLRYMFRSNLSLVPIKDEIKHIINYLSMQEIRFHGGLSHITNIDKKFYDILIPPFTIHTFVENIIKHAVPLEEPVNIFIKVGQIKINDKDFIRILIEDDGIGFTEEAIKQINCENQSKDDGKSIGIWNVRQTLNLIYSDRARLSVSNSDLMGTMVEILIPIERSNDEHTDF